MHFKYVSAKSSIDRFLITSMLGAFLLFFYVIYTQMEFFHFDDFENNNWDKIWNIKFIFILPFWLLISYVKSIKSKKLWFAHSLISALLLVPGVFILMRIFQDQVTFNLQKIGILLAILFSILLLYRHYVAHKYGDVKFGWLEFLFSLFVLFNFLILNFLA